ncbi:hypothetical protein [Caulobacter mirabilis]|uniref:Uncharacterized protein n=1 Tax=Caulobacter mirabilis TaxID=69666 RepID=A0A2D2ATU8_9CAUL|nr:hypothetical protein [Caulobacter mirabilis]ATQ41385.1 hypothetical protein CSW64_02620 [Caulobacter mirabilis]
MTDEDLKALIARLETGRTATLDRDDLSHAEFEQLATAAMAAANDLANALRRKHDAAIRAGGAAQRAGDTAGATEAFARADAIKPCRDQAQMLGFQLDRAIIAWLDGAPDVAAAKAAVKGATADLKKTKDDFAKTADSLSALAGVLGAVTGVVKSVQTLLASPAAA